MVQRHGRGGSMLYIARLLGRDAVEKLTSRTGLKQIDEFFENMDVSAYSLQDCCRLFPLIS